MVPIDFWLLCAAPAVGQLVPPDAHVALCRDVVEEHRAGNPAATQEAIDALSAAGKPIAVELGAGDGQRCFRLPHRDAPLTLLESSFGEAGFGHRVWEAGIGLAIWLSLNPSRLHGKRVLELGSGVGIAGITAAGLGTDSVTLTDTDGVQRHLERNVEACCTAAAATALDWHACLDARFEPLGTFAIILASDCIYYERDAEVFQHGHTRPHTNARPPSSCSRARCAHATQALAAAVRCHLAPGGSALLLNRRGREGRAEEALLERLETGGLGRVHTRDLALVGNFGSTDLQLVSVQG
jgi:hypothetical protein